MTFAHSSRGRLTEKDRGRFPGETLFDRIGRAVCEAGCLPRKELYEAWEVARRSRRLFGGGRVVDLCGGHGLLAQVMLLLDDSSPAALVVDTVVPPSAAAVRDALGRTWPRLSGRIEYVESSLEAVSVVAGDVVVSSHACGTLTDRVLDLAIAGGASVAVLPCCHDLDLCDTGGLTGWLDPSLAIDVVRARRLMGAGYRVWTQTIPEAITPKNRLLLARRG